MGGREWLKTILKTEVEAMCEGRQISQCNEMEVSLLLVFASGRRLTNWVSWLAKLSIELKGHCLWLCRDLGTDCKFGRALGVDKDAKS